MIPVPRRKEMWEKRKARTAGGGARPRRITCWGYEKMRAHYTRPTFRVSNYRHRIERHFFKLVLH